MGMALALDDPEVQFGIAANAFGRAAPWPPWWPSARVHRKPQYARSSADTELVDKVGSPGPIEEAVRAA